MSNEKKEKQLLNEGEVRKFMKLANLNSIGFLKELYGKMGEEEDEMPEPEMDADVEAPLPPEDEMPEPEMEEPIAGGAADEQLVKDIVDAVADAIQNVTGVEVEVEGEPVAPAPEAEEALPVDAAPETEVAPEVEVEDEEEENLDEKLAKSGLEVAEENQELDEKKLEKKEEKKCPLDEKKEEEEELDESAKEPYKGAKDQKMKPLKLKDSQLKENKKLIEQISKRVAKRLLALSEKKQANKKVEKK